MRSQIAQEEASLQQPKVSKQKPNNPYPEIETKPQQVPQQQPEQPKKVEEPKLSKDMQELHSQVADAIVK